MNSVCVCVQVLNQLFEKIITLDIYERPYNVNSACLCVQALNQLFEKIIALDIDERHLLRLGHGEEALETNKDFSRWVALAPA